MVVHQAIGNYSYAVFPHFLFNVLQQKHIICIVAKDNAFMRTAIVDVIVVIRTENGFSACHEDNYIAEGASHLLMV